MNTSLDCIPCVVNSFVKLFKNGDLNNETKELALKKLLEYLSIADYSLSPPVLGKEMHRIMREYLNDPDPYYDIKIKYNKMILDMYSELKSKVITAENPINMAMRLAIAGNAIDFGAQVQYDIMDTIERVLNTRIDIDDSVELINELNSAKKLLYIGDNCGEIVFDKLLLETIDISQKVFVVRGGPVLNDITIDDAKSVGMDKIAKIISTGDNAPGAVWESTSDEFKQHMNEADIIISKGQGNLEGLFGNPNNIYYLLIAKCDLIGKFIGTTKGEFVIKKNPHYKNAVLT